MRFERSLVLPEKSFFLFGPRGTGKSTLLKTQRKFALEVDLLKSSQFIPLSQNPSLLQEWTGHLKPGEWVLIDEVQKIPALLDEVHSLYEERGLNFALSGSSARKLKRGGANLLAGRALQNFLFPLVSSEFRGAWSLMDAVEWGTLPLVVTDKKNATETLASYVETYLRQELIEEGLVRKLEPFARFLQAAGLYNGQVLNVENLAREASLGRTSVDKYFEILEDTLIGFRLPAFQARIKVKESHHPKFYLFDAGVARACASLLTESVDSVWKGFSLETCVLNEIRAYNEYSRKRRGIFYYKVSGGEEIDFVIETKRKTLSHPGEVIAIEVKFAKKWDAKWSRSLREFGDQKGWKVKQAFGLYLGDRILTQEGVTVLPVTTFFERLHQGKIY
jgi:uncharacterized protein